MTAPAEEIAAFTEAVQAPAGCWSFDATWSTSKRIPPSAWSGRLDLDEGTWVDDGTLPYGVPMPVGGRATPYVPGTQPNYRQETCGNLLSGGELSDFKGKVSTLAGGSRDAVVLDATSVHDSDSNLHLELRPGEVRVEWSSWGPVNTCVVQVRNRFVEMVSSRWTVANGRFRSEWKLGPPRVCAQPPYQRPRLDPVPWTGSDPGSVQQLLRGPQCGIATLWRDTREAMVVVGPGGWAMRIPFFTGRFVPDVAPFLVGDTNQWTVVPTGVVQSEGLLAFDLPRGDAPLHLTARPLGEGLLVEVERTTPQRTEHYAVTFSADGYPTEQTTVYTPAAGEPTSQTVTFSPFYACPPGIEDAGGNRLAYPNIP
jgi:hypothetical protein